MVFRQIKPLSIQNWPFAYRSHISFKSSISSSRFGWVIIKSVLELILLYLQVYSALLNLKWLLSDNFDESKIFVVGGSVFASSGVRGVKWYSHVISIRSSPFFTPPPRRASTNGEWCKHQTLHLHSQRPRSSTLINLIGQDQLNCNILSVLSNTA